MKEGTTPAPTPINWDEILKEWDEYMESIRKPIKIESPQHKSIPIDWDEIFGTKPSSGNPTTHKKNSTTPSPRTQAKNSTHQKGTKLTASVFAVAMAFIMLVTTLCFTAYKVNQANEATKAAEAIIQSAAADKDNILAEAETEVNNKIAEAEAEAKKILEE